MQMFIFPGCRNAPYSAVHSNITPKNSSQFITYNVSCAKHSQLLVLSFKKYVYIELLIYNVQACPQEENTSSQHILKCALRAN